MRTSSNHVVTILAAMALGLALAAPAVSHCDAMDGPVVTEAKQALADGDVTSVLKWVGANDEQEVRDVFDQALVVRQHGDEAREMADRLFFETLVRLHRAYEGASFTGLKPAGGEVSPAIARADAALDAGDVDELAHHIAHAVQQTIRERFDAAHQARQHKDESVEAGRRFVDRYVAFVHYVKHLHELVSGAHDVGHGHGQAEDHGRH